MPRIAYLLSHAMWSALPMRRSRQMAGLRLAATGRAGPAGPDMCGPCSRPGVSVRSEEHTSELQSRRDLVCRLLLEKKKKKDNQQQNKKNKKKKKLKENKKNKK